VVDPVKPFSVLVYASQKHSAADLAASIKGATECTQQEAEEKAKRALTEGRDVVYVAHNLQACLRISEALEQASIPCAIQRVDTLFSQDLAVFLLGFLTRLSKYSPAKRRLLLQEVTAPSALSGISERLDALIMTDLGLWKSARVGIKDFLQATFFTDTVAFLDTFGSLVLGRFPNLAEYHLKRDPAPEHSVVALTSQFFSAPGIALRLACQYDVLVHLLDSLRIVGSDQQVPNSVLYAPVYQHLFSVLQVPEVVTHIASSPKYLGAFLAYLSLFQGAHPQRLALIPQPEDQRGDLDSLLAVLNFMHLLCSSIPFFSLSFSQSQPQLLGFDWALSTTRDTIKSWQTLSYARTQPGGGSLDQKTPGTIALLTKSGDFFDLPSISSSDSVEVRTSLFHPLHWVFASLIQRVLESPSADLLDLPKLLSPGGAGDLTPLLIAEGPLKAHVMVAMAAAGLIHEKNGEIGRLALVYRMWKRDRTFDNDLLVVQAYAVAMNPNHFIGILLDRFFLAKWFSPKPTPKFGEKEVASMTKEFLALLIYVVNERWITGRTTPEKKIKTHLVNLLASGPHSLSELQGKFSDDLSNHPKFREILTDFSELKKASDGKTETYLLRDFLFKVADPHSFHLSLSDRKNLEDVLRRRRQTAPKTTEPFSLRRLTPLHKAFLPLEALVHCKAFVEVVFYGLWLHFSGFPAKSPALSRRQDPTVFAMCLKLLTLAMQHSESSTIAPTDLFVHQASTCLFDIYEEKTPISLVDLLVRIKLDPYFPEDEGPLFTWIFSIFGRLSKDQTLASALTPVQANPPSNDQTSSSTDDFPTEGMTLEGLKVFIDANGGCDGFEGLKTSEVCELFLKPATIDQQESYCIAYKNHPSQTGNISKATAFVSHAWGHEFMDVVAALEAHQAAQSERIYFWFDIFSNNQHKTGTRDFTWWQTVFRDNIGKLKKTLLVLEWDDPKPLARAWCLWEMISTVDTKADFRVLMSPTNRASFSEALENRFDTIVYKTCNVDLRQAKAFFKSDEANIKKAVEATAGFEELNKQVIGIMKEWMAEQGKDELAKVPEKQRPTCRLQLALALLFHEQGKLPEAEALYRSSYEGFRLAGGENDPVTLRTMTSLANVLTDQGKHEEAMPLLRGAMEGIRSLYSLDNSEVLNAMNNYALALGQQGKFGDAEVILEEVVRRKSALLGEKDPLTLTSLANYADILSKGGKLSETEGIMRRVLFGFRGFYGDTHPKTLYAINNLATLLEKKGHLSEAETLLRESLEGKRRTLGDKHVDTLVGLENLGAFHQNHGNASEAEKLLREALSGRLKTLGSNPLQTHHVQEALGTLLKDQGKLSEAIPLLMAALSGYTAVIGPEQPATLDCLFKAAVAWEFANNFKHAEALLAIGRDMSRTTFGPTHAKTLAYLHNYGKVLAKSGKFSEAEAPLRESLAGRREAIGNAHADTLDTMDTLATVLRSQGKFSEAEPLQQEALDGFRQTHGSQHPFIFFKIYAIGQSLQTGGRKKEAERQIEEAVTGFRNLLAGPPPHSLLAKLMMKDLGIPETPSQGAVITPHGPPEVANSSLQASPAPSFVVADVNATAQNDFPTEGMTLEGLKVFIDANGGCDGFEGLKTSEVCELFLKPATTDQQESYCIAYKNHPSQTGNISKATAFVSHAWGHEFMDVVAALEAHQAAQSERIYFWFDIFSNNQHKTGTRDFTWWQTVFRDNIGKLKKTLLVLEWDDPKPLARAWCLWEMISAVDTKSELQVLLSPKNEISFAENIVNDLNKVVANYCTVDLRQAKASISNDQSNIFKVIEATCGFEEADKQIVAVMKKWIARSAVEILPCLPQSDLSTPILQTNLAKLLQEQGAIGEAETLYMSALDLRRRHLGDRHPETLLSMINLAKILADQGDPAQTEPLFREALACYQSGVTADRVPLYLCLSNLGSLLLGQKRPREAEPLLREALDGLRRSLPETDAVVVQVKEQLASTFRELGRLIEAAELNKQGRLIDGAQLNKQVQFNVNVDEDRINALLLSTADLQKQRKFAEAEGLLREALKELGDSHPSSLLVINILGTGLRSQGKLAEAGALFQEALDTGRRILGRTHINTRLSMNNLALILQDQEKFDEAELLLREALEGRRGFVGGADRVTLTAMSTLATLLERRGKFSEAESLMREVASGYRFLVGDQDDMTMMATNRLGMIMGKQQRHGEAEVHFKQALAASRQSLGSSHPTTRLFLINVSEVLQAQKKLAEAEPLLQEIVADRRRTLGATHPQTVESVQNLGSILLQQGKLSEAEPLLRESLDYSRRNPGNSGQTKNTDYDLLSKIFVFGAMRQKMGELKEAEPLLIEAVEGFRGILDPTDVIMLQCLNSCGAVFQARGKFSMAEPLFKEELEGMRKSLGNTHLHTLSRMSQLGGFLQKAKQLSEAETMLREAIEGYQCTLGRTHVMTISTTSTFAKVLLDQLKFDEAEANLRVILDTVRGADDESLLQISLASLNLGLALRGQDRLDEAELFLKAGWKDTRRLGDRNLFHLIAGYSLGLVQKEMGKLHDAEVLLRDVLRGLHETVGEKHFRAIAITKLLNGMVDRETKVFDGAPPPLEIGDFPLEGISMEGINLFINSHGGEGMFQGLMTSEVCDIFLKPDTVTAQESFCRTFRSKGPRGREIGQATAFVSHAWKHQFLDVVAALREYDKGQPTVVYFWFDIFSNNQHKTNTRDFAWWQTVFRDNIGRLKKTLLVLEWEDPKPLTRAWCLWEIVSTVNTKADFQVLMSPWNQDTFAIALMEECDRIAGKLCKVDLRQAEACSKSDEANIKKAVENSAGFEEVNKKVIGIMREWMTRCGRKSLAEIPPGERALSNLQNNLGELLFQQGKLEEARDLLEEAVAAKRSTLGVQNELTIKTISNLGAIYLELEEVDKGEALLREALAAARKICRPEDPATISACYSLANLLYFREKYEEAESLFRECIAAQSADTDTLNRESLLSLGALGVVLQAREKFDEAEISLKEALQGQRSLLGPTHPETLAGLGNFGTFLFVRRRFSEAEGIIGEVLPQMRQIFGDDHNTTLITAYRMACVLTHQGKFEEARKVAEDLIPRQLRAKGREHPQSIWYICLLEQIMRALGRLREAEDLMHEAIDASRAHYGPDDPETVMVVEGLALFLRDQSRWAESEPLFRDLIATAHRTSAGKVTERQVDNMLNLGHALFMQGKYEEASSLEAEALDEAKRALGDSHLLTLTAMNNLGKTFSRLGRLMEAEKLLRDALATKREVLGLEHQETIRGIVSLGMVLADSGKIAEAEPLLREGHDLAVRILGLEHQITKNCEKTQAELVGTAVDTTPKQTQSIHQPSAADNPAQNSVPRRDLTRWIPGRRRYLVLGGVFLGMVAWLTFTFL